MDISYFKHNYLIRKDLLLAFKQSGFSVSSIEDPYKLLPCSLGTFVKASAKDPKCLECPAGNFSLTYDTRVTHLEISVMNFFSLNAKHVLTVILLGVSLFFEMILRVQKSTRDVKKVSTTKYIPSTLQFIFSRNLLRL